MLNKQHALDAYDIKDATLDLINKVTFIPKKGYTKSWDDETYFDFGGNISSKVRSIAKMIDTESYGWSPLKLIRKKAKLNKIRDIYLSTWSDRIVETWLNKSLTILLHDWFAPQSFAYRIDGMCVDSCQRIISRQARLNSYFVKRDISKYFYSIDKQILIGQLKELFEGYLLDLLIDRINFKYIDSGELKASNNGIPFGSPLACVLSNIHLTHIDKGLSNFNIGYFRYADDVLIMSTDGNEALKAANYFDNQIEDINLKLKPSHKLNLSWEKHDKFEQVDRFKHLGLEFTKEKTRFSIEKQRKIINFVKRELKDNKWKILKKKGGLDARVKFAIECVNNVLERRVRSVAIIDYYLKHSSDEKQLKDMDRIITEMVISAVIGKPFKQKMFKKISYKKLRDMGLPSLLHRSRLLRHGHIKTNFLDLRDSLRIERYFDTLERREARVKQLRLGKKLKRMGIDPASSHMP